MASIPMTPVRTVSVPETVPMSILVRAHIANRLFNSIYFQAPAFLIQLFFLFPQNALLKQLLQGSAAAETAAASANSSSASPSTVSSTTSNLAAVTTTTTNNSSKPTSLMSLLAKPLTPSKVPVSSSGISTTNYGGGVAPNSSTPTTTSTKNLENEIIFPLRDRTSEIVEMGKCTIK